MNSITSLHQKAMELADQAFVARLNGDLDKAKEFSRSAFEFERVLPNSYTIILMLSLPDRYC